MILDYPEMFINFRGYRGNRNVKKAGVQQNWSMAMLEEWDKCSKDYIYFIETYMKIINTDEGLIPFILREYQKEIIHSIHNNRNTIMCTARQAGKSTSFVAYVCWYVIFNPNVLVAILANKASTAREMLGKIRLAWENLPKWMQQGITEGGWNKGSLELENNSRCLAEASSADSIRGLAVNLLILDEVAQIEHWDEFQASTLPTIVSGKTTKIVQVSTPFGLNHFYNTWTSANKPKDSPEWNGYNPIMVPWNQVPGRDAAWRQSALAELNFNLEKFAQEYECEFMGSSGTLIAGWKLKELVAQVPLSFKDGLSQYKEVVKDHSYAITADVSSGKGLDYSVFHVTDITEMPFQQVAVFRSNEKTPRDFADVVHVTAKYYNNALFLVEFEKFGSEVASCLYYDYEYENVLQTEAAGAKGKKISFGSGNKTDLGLVMGPKVKAVGCSLMKLLIEQNQYIINSGDTIFELSRFSKKGKSYEAEEGCHDDCVMSLLLFAWLSNEQYFKDLTDLETLTRLKDRSEQETMDEYQSMVGFSTYGDDIEAEPDPQPFKGWFTESFEDHNPFKEDIPKQVYRFGLKTADPTRR